MSLELESQFVKKGVWTNLEQGPILGRTITTDTQTGNLLVALLAVLSTLATAHLWHLLAFAIHQIRASGRPTDALFRQQQALLRTLPTPSSVVADVLKLWWAWRKKATRPFLRSIVLILVALVFTTATIAASVFSSLIVDSGTIDVLVQSPLCGRINSTGEAWRSYTIALDQSAPTYAQNCYNNGSLPATCNVFMRPNIPLQVENVPCPFINKTMCDTEDAVSVDSGLLDVNKVFGVNLLPRDGVRIRKKTVCSVLPIEGYYEIVNLTDAPRHWLPSRGAFPGEQVVALYYGPTNDLRSMQSFIFSLVLSNTTGGPRTYGGRTYYNAPNNTAPPGFYPLESLMPLDGLVGDIFWKPVASNSITYVHPVDDPLYSAHKEIEEFDDTILAFNTRYTPDYPMRGVGCTQHFQICHARGGKDDFCTPMQGIPFFDLRDFDFPEATSNQRAVLQLLFISSWIYDTAGVKTNKAMKLMSRSEAVIDSLPNDFWKQEVVGWEQETWAGMQIMFTQYAIGPKANDKLADDYWIKPETSGEKTLCQAQKMKKSGDFVNINVFGLSFVVAFSVLVAIIDITLLKFLLYLSRFRRALGPRIARWTQDGVWQLQRRAYEGEGHRNWTDLEGEIPLMDQGHTLKDLPIMWLPGKSPMVMQSETSASTGSQTTLRNDVLTQDDEPVEEHKGPARIWLRFWRH